MPLLQLAGCEPRLQERITVCARSAKALARRHCRHCPFANWSEHTTHSMLKPALLTCLCAHTKWKCRRKNNVKRPNK